MTIKGTWKNWRRRQERKRKSEKEGRKPKRRKLDKLVGWGEAQDEDPSQDEGLNSWLHPAPALEPDKPTEVFQMAGQSRLEQDLEKQVLKETEKKENDDAGGETPFVFQKKGKISKKEAEELRRTHKDLNHWFLLPKRAGLEASKDDEQEKIERDYRLEGIKRKRAAWEAQRVCKAVVVELLEAALLDQDKADQDDHGDA